MYQHFIQQAHDKKIRNLLIKLFVEKNGKLLVLQSQGEARSYDLPSGTIIQEESISQAIQRILVETISLSLKEVVSFVTFRDNALFERTFYFIVTVHDPEDLLLRKEHAFGWVDPKELFGYPIKDNLREILDLYLKIKG